MPSTYSNLKIQLMATGENNTTWGDVTNLNLGTALEEAIVGSADVPFSSADVTLTLTDTNASQTARNMRLNLTGTATAGYNLIVPAIEKPYIINNATDGTITVKNATGTGIAVPAGKTMWVYNNGTNVVDAVTRLSSLTLGTDLAVADGGTGASTFTSNGVLIGNGTSAITATAAGTTGQVLVGNTGGAPSWATLSGIGVTSFSGGTTGLTPSTGTTGAITLAGTLNVANGGTGATSLSSGYLVKGNGTSAVSASMIYDTGTIVGIGTTAPNGILSVVGDQISVGSAPGSGSLGIQIKGTTLSAIPAAQVQSYIATGSSSMGSAGDLLIAPRTDIAANIRFITGTTPAERVRIDGSGNVGIGTSSPSYRLDIPATGAVGANLGGILIGANGTDIVGSVGPLSLQATGANYVSLNTNSSERMRIDSSGNVLIGTTTAVDNNFPLELNAGTSSVRGMGVNNNGGYGVYLTYDNTNRYATNGAAIRNVANSPLYFETNNTLRATLDASGNLGLGVTPSAWTGRAFQVGSTSAFYQPAASYTNLSSNFYEDTEGAARYLTNGFATLYSSNRDAGIHAWYTAPSGTAGNAISFSQVMTLNASGNLGVGTSSPTQKLHVIGNTLVPINNSYYCYTSDYGIGTPDGSGLQVFASNGDTLRFGHRTGGTTFTENMRIASNGDVGIGTSSPGMPLDVQSNASALGIRIRGRAADNIGLLQFSSNSLGSSAYISSTGSLLSFETGGAERMRIDGSGNLLVGKTALDTTVVGVQMQGNGTITSTRSGSTNATSTMEVYSTGAGAYRFYVDMSGTIGATNTSISAISDIRLKENVRDLDAGLDTILALKPRRFDWKEGKGKDIKDDMGFIAQEVEEVLPALIGGWKAGEGEPDDLKSVKAGDLIPVLVKAIQELTARVAQLEGN